MYIYISDILFSPLFNEGSAFGLSFVLSIFKGKFDV